MEVFSHGGNGGFHGETRRLLCEKEVFSHGGNGGFHGETRRLLCKKEVFSHGGVHQKNKQLI
jgi:hypothetical protein